MVEWIRVFYDKKQQRCEYESKFAWLQKLVKSNHFENLDTFLGIYNLSLFDSNGIGVIRIDQKEFTVVLKKTENRSELILFYSPLLTKNIDLLQNFATVDQLTGALLKREGIYLLEHHLRIFFRYGTPFSIIMCDIDFFKSVNDTYGHLVGDTVLKYLVEIIRNNIRSCDLLVRFGGEEFLLILPNARAVEALRIAEKLRVTIEKEIIYTSDKEIDLTMSFGISTPKRSDSEEGLIERADKALYMAKSRGRNRFEYV